MSKNFNRAKGKKAHTNRELLYKAILNIDPYFDECWAYQPLYRRGFKNPNKVLYMYQVRLYRTWKYNRKTQYKNNKI